MLIKHNKKRMSNAYQTQQKTTNCRMTLRHDKVRDEVITTTVIALLQ